VAIWIFFVNFGSYAKFFSNWKYGVNWHWRHYSRRRL